MSKKSKHVGYGWTPDLPDIRDYKFKSQRRKLPGIVDLRPGMPPVYDQGQLGSCTANAIGAAFEFDLRKQGVVDFMPSRLFIYYNERVMEGSVKQDAGAMIRDGIKSISLQGVCPESLWPYRISRFATKPAAKCYSTALSHQSVHYERVSPDLMKACLASGFPIVLGFTVYESFESQKVADTGSVPMPKAGEAVLGGHAIVVCGYLDNSQQFICRNSWGSGWGSAGYMLMPYDYLLNSDLADDRWKITQVEG